MDVPDPNALMLPEDNFTALLERRSTYRRSNSVYTKEEELNLNSFKKIKEIGEGSYGVIYLVENKSTKEKYAMK